MKQKSVSVLKFLLCFTSVVILVGATVILYIYYNNKACRKEYSFINAMAVWGEDPVIKKTGYAELQSEIEKYIESKKEAGEINSAAMYFRDLKNGPVFGINETAEFAPASLLKLPLALVYLVQAERNKEVLDQTLVFTDGLEGFSQTFRPPESLVQNEVYTIDELMMRMLKYSDNDSYAVLIDNLLDNGGEDLMTETFLSLGFIAPNDPFDQVISVRRYGSIFRSLYNTSILNAELSEKVLSWLSESSFEKGIPSGLGEGVKVSHKFGERFYSDDLKQLHDCGIIYFPKNPYLLCIMTEGKDFDLMIEVISKISKDVYTEVEGRRI